MLNLRKKDVPELQLCEKAIECARNMDLLENRLHVVSAIYKTFSLNIYVSFVPRIVYISFPVIKLIVFKIEDSITNVQIMINVKIVSK